MANPLNYFIQDPDAMKYELMRAQAEGMAAGGTVRGYAGGGKVYGSEVPDATPPVEQMRREIEERSWLDTLGGAGETALGFLTGAVAQPAAGIAGAVGETFGLGRGEDIAGRVVDALTYTPTTAAGQTMSQDLMDLMVKSGVASLPPVVSGVNPAALRVNPGAGRYAAGQAVEAARPLHEAYMAGEVPGLVDPAASVIKNKGGNWFPGSIEKTLDNIKHYEPNMPEKTPVNDWVDTKLEKYIRNQLGTPEDPIRALAENDKLHVPSTALIQRIGEGDVLMDSTGIAVKRTQHGFPIESAAETPAGRSWEASADMLVKGNTAEEWLKNASSENLKKMPWINKLESSTPVYEITHPHAFNTALGFDHLIDELQNAVKKDESLSPQLHIDPDKLQKMSVPEVVQHIDKINKYREANRAQAALEAQKDIKVHKEYDDKHRWVQLTKPGEFAMESDAMGHSVRGYEPPLGHSDWIKPSGNAGHERYGQGGWDAIKNGDAQVYSLRDPKGKSLATIEATKSYSSEASGENPLRITQVKGAGNKEVPEGRAQELVKDFLNSQNLTDVAEAGGLIDTSKEILLGNKILGLRIPLTAKEVQAKLPRFVTEQDLIDLAASGYDKYARGGAVKPRGVVSAAEEPYNLDEMRHALVRQR